MVAKGQSLRVLGTNPSIHLDTVVAKRKHSRDSPVAKHSATQSPPFSQSRGKHVGTWQFVSVYSVGLIHHQWRTCR